MSRWHAREHGKALRAMQQLTLEERGAYNTCLDLIYEREGPIPDDPRWLAGWMGVSLRKWSSLRAVLIVKGKLFEVVVNTVPSLMNERAVIELENQSERARNLAEAGAKGGRKTAETRANNNKNNDAQQANAAPTLKLITSTETVTEKNTADDSARARFSDVGPVDLDGLEAKLREAAGASVNAASPMLKVVSPILALLRPGEGPAADLDLDVLPAIRATASRVSSPKTRWDYFVPMITEARDRRLRGAPAMAEASQLRATGPPASYDEKIRASWDEATRRIAESDG